MIISQKPVWLTTRKYERIKLTGIVFSIVVIVALSVVRFVLDRQLFNGLPKSAIIALNVDLMFVTEAILLVSVVLMIDTLRRLKKSFVQNPRFLQNRSTMEC